MASSSGSSGSAPLPPGALDCGERNLRDAEPRRSSTASGRSLGLGSETPVCAWRTRQFHDQECTRYFDCPSHTVERRLSMDENYESSPDESAPATDHDLAEDELYSNEAEHSSVTNGARQAATELDLAPSELEAGSSSSSHRAATEAHSEEESRVQRTNSSQEHTVPPSSGNESSLMTFHQLGHSAPSPPLVDAHSISEEQESGQIEPPESPISPLSRHSGRTAASVPIPHHGDGGLEQTVSALSTRQSHQNRARDSPNFVLPRWQPDVEATYCPICHTQFSVFVRKHHCR